MKSRIAIVGAGPVGCLLSILLSRRGFAVHVLEKRPDWRFSEKRYSGRSINLALSDRGFKALRLAGLDKDLLRLCVPMRQRAIHQRDGEIHHQPYDSFGNSIKSISRESVNTFLLNEALLCGVRVVFGVDVRILPGKVLEVRSSDGVSRLSYDFLFGCDGAASMVRGHLNRELGLEAHEQVLGYGYKELTIKKAKMWNENSLHIWPRKRFMLIALPNLDETYTGTLFMPYQGENSFEVAGQDVIGFFENHFPDAVPQIERLDAQFESTPVSGLRTLLNDNWYSKLSGICLLGDSAHAIVPFYGQGLNAGFEDVDKFVGYLDEHGSRLEEFPFERFFAERKKDTDAIAKLALQNFDEMRSDVADEEFRAKKRIDNHLYSLFPEVWVPQYSLVTFKPEVGYAKALAVGELQRKYLDELFSAFGDVLLEKSAYESYMKNYEADLLAS